MTWVKPTGFVDSGGTWSSETSAYDNDTGTYAIETIDAVGWGNYLELTHSAIDCDKVQIWSSYQANMDVVEVDVYYNSGWHSIYSGSITVGAFVEYAIGSTQSVTSVRIRYSTTKKGRWCGVNEVDFNEISVASYYHGLSIQGVGELALCDVGTNPLRIRKGGTTYGIELVETGDPNASAIRIQTGTGVKSIRKYT